MIGPEDVRLAFGRELARQRNNPREQMNVAYALALAARISNAIAMLDSIGHSLLAAGMIEDEQLTDIQIQLEEIMEKVLLQAAEIKDGEHG